MRIELTEEMKTDIVDKISQGMNTQQIAMEYHVSKSCMARIISKIDIEELMKDKKVVRCTQEICSMCYYGSTKGNMCNYCLVVGHSRTIAGTHTNESGQIVADIKNPVKACGEFIYSKTKAIEQNQIDMM